VRATGSVEPPCRRPLVSVLVPCFNEAPIIAESLERILAELHALEGRCDWELVVVDDGSTDGTGDIVEDFAGHHQGVRLLRHRTNFRLGQALRFGFGHTHGDYVVVIDADLSYSPDHIGRLVAAIDETRAKVVLASPYMKGGRTSKIPFVRRVMSRSVNRMLGAVAHGNLSTLTGMVRAYDGPFIRSLNLKAMGPEINTEIIYKAQLLRAQILEIPAHLDWTGQQERARTRRPSLRIKATTKLQLFSGFIFRPVLFFFIPGLLALALAAWTLGSVAVTIAHQWGHLTGGWDPRLTKAVQLAYAERPQSFIAGGVCLLLGVQLLSLGVLAAQAKRYFEELFHLGTTVLRQLRSRQDKD